MSNNAVRPHDDEAGEEIWRELEKADGDGGAAQEMLAAGFPIYYREAGTPRGLQIKEYPGGRRELVRVQRSGDEVVGAL